MKVKPYIFALSFLIFQAFSVSTTAAITLVSWNIRDFGKSKDADEIKQIAKILEDFDIVALQEVVAGYGGAQAVAQLADELNRTGTRWDYKISEPTKSPKYKTERYAFLWKTNKTKLIGNAHLASGYAREIYREPFIARFKVGESAILVVNYHSRRFDEHPEEEIKYFPALLQEYPNDAILVAGDFNLKQDEPVFASITELGYCPALFQQATTLKRGCTLTGNYLNHPIDNIFYAQNKFILIESHALDFVRNCDRLEQMRKLSDHLPVYLKFEVKK